MLAALKAWAKRLKREVVALWIAARRADTPWFARLIALLVAAYALSPIDLIPDFIPVLGLLDDLLIVPLGIALAVRCIPSALMARYRAEAADRAERPSSRAGVIIVMVVWAVGLGACLFWLAG
ncbi:YkvA family protein [Sphingobium sp.]|uniref:YkvA family protein n=1 Tax=Sphingobium sp. TaxID=1912891 RepID=UPI0025E0B164|nr:YkvA family protein [Sphingobium sp.]